jgi:hypothetical protein
MAVIKANQIIPPKVPAAEISKKRQPPRIHTYSQELAEELNPQQPDISGALLIGTLAIWQNNRYKQTLIDGRRYCFRSLAELQKEMPYLTRSGLQSMIVKLEKKLGPEEFLVRRDKDKLWFSLGPETLRKARAKRRIAVNIEAAVRCKNVRCGVIYSNLEYNVTRMKRLKSDGYGNFYTEMSPAKLAKCLKVSTDTIVRCLNRLKEKRVIVQHMKVRTAYALFTGFIGWDAYLAAEMSRKAAKLATKSAKLDT